MNSHTNSSVRIIKLLEQYREHNNLAIGVDFDFTIYDPIKLETHTDLIKLLKEAQQLGCKLCLWTARTPVKVEEAVSICAWHGLNFDFVNESSIKFAEPTVKPHFNLLLDDTAGLGQAIKILTGVLTCIKEDKNVSTNRL